PLSRSTRFAHFILRRIEQVIHLFQIIKRAMNPPAAPIEVATGFCDQQVIEGARDKVANLFGVVQCRLTLIEEFFHLPKIVTGTANFIPALFLKQRAGPLRKVTTPMMLGIPSATMHLDFFGWRKSAEILTNMDGRKPKRSGAITIQQRPKEVAPKTALDLGCSKPAAI